MTLASLSRLLAFALLISVAGCDTSEGPSLFDPERQLGTAPIVTGVVPEGSALAGIDEITITGSNFSETAGDNLVFFGDTPAEILSASSTELRVKAPNTPGEGLALRVSVRGALEFSPSVPYTLGSALTPFGELSAELREEVRALTPDGEGGLYVSFLAEGRSRGILRFDADGSRTPYYEGSGVWSGLSLDGSSQLLGVRRVRALFSLPDVGDPQTVAVVEPGNVLASVVAAPAGGVYTGGTGPLYYIAPDGTPTSTPFEEPVSAMAVHDGALYVATITTTTSRVYRMAIEGDASIGPASVYYDVTADRGPGISINAIAFAADGTLLIGTNAPDPIFEIAPDGTSSVLYPGVLAPPVSGFAWGSGTTLYVATTLISSSLPGGPSTPATLYALNTRRQAP